MGDSEESTAQKFLDFLNEAWTPFHAVKAAQDRLQEAGFEYIREGEAWGAGRLKRGGKYFYTRNQSSIVAFAVGAHFEPAVADSASGFSIIGAHTDSPCIKLKPVSKFKKAGYQALNVVPYGGGLWHTWFDRDLSVAGRVVVRRGDKVTTDLVRIERPILKIPNLAIHLCNEEERAGFNPNPQINLPPVLCSEIKASQLLSAPKGDESGGSPIGPHHHPLLMDIIAREVGVAVEQIMDMELQLCEVQPSCLCGALGEFISSGRLDNLASCYQALMALIESCATPGALDAETNVRLIALFDNEEVGSVSAQGAQSTLLPEALKRITEAFEGPSVERALRHSFIVSADNAHGLHYNYDHKHDPLLQPKLHAGLVIKHNANQRYASTAITSHIFREIGRRAGVPVQEFAVRSDGRCGSTIGPLVSALSGVRTVDVGSPQWAMHSIRETMGTADVHHGYRHFKAFFEMYSAMQNTEYADVLDA